MAAALPEARSNTGGASLVRFTDDDRRVPLNATGGKLVESAETAIIGAGQAGLAVAACLAQQGRECLVLERGRGPGESWRSARWDSFTLVTPNWSVRLPGLPYDGPEPDGFLPKAAIVAYFERYAARAAPAIRANTEVTSVVRDAGSGRFRLETSVGPLSAASVVVATGSFQEPRVPVDAARLPASVLQLHPGNYRNPESLPEGAVLVVGSAQSGCQISEELRESGRRVYLSVGGAGRVQRRYRGRDMYWWLTEVGFFDQTLDRLPNPRARFAANPALSGKGGGRTLNLHRFARDGITLLGRVAGIDAEGIAFAPDLHEGLAKADRVAAEITQMVDGFIARTGIDAPPPDPEPALTDGFAVAPLARLDLRAAGVSTIIWATGFRADFSWVRAAPLDGDGLPVQQRGVTPVPGLYFVGLNWLHTRKSALLLGVGEDAAHVASTIAASHA